MENKKIDEKISNQLNRMKAMMNYGLKTETKQYSTVEYSKKAADGKTYGIIREGNKYHIKVADVKNPSKSDFNYIGGFANHKTNMFESYANAQKHFDMKMRSLNEAYGKVGENVDSWNMNGRNQVLNEMTDKMRLEISRQREIMKNANIIAEGKKENICKDKACCLEKNNIKMTKPQTGDAKGNGGDFFTEKPGNEFSDNEKNNIKGKQSPVLENVENESFNDTSLDDESALSGGGLDDSLGEGSDDFEETDIDVTDDGEGDVDVDIDTEEDFDDETGEDDFSSEIEDDEELEEFPEEDKEEFEDDSLTAENEGDEISALRGELDNLRSTIEAIAAKLGVDEFDTDEPLYNDDEDFESEEDFDGEDEDDFEIETSVENEEGDEDEDFEEDDEETEVYESRHYRQVMAEGKKIEKLKNAAKNIGKKVGKGLKKAYDNWEEGNRRAMDAPNSTCDDEEWDNFEKKHGKKGENLEETELHDWGKHPRYQKEPMTYPNPKMSKKPGQYDEGEGEETTRKPYGKQVGDGKFFDQTKDVERISNSIAESIIRRLNRKND